MNVLSFNKIPKLRINFCWIMWIQQWINKVNQSDKAHIHLKYGRPAIIKSRKCKINSFWYTIWYNGGKYKLKK